MNTYHYRSQSSSRFSFQSCLERGVRTRRHGIAPMYGEALRTPSGLWARFGAHVHQARFQALHFECSACVTLVVYCQALIEIIEGAEVDASILPAVDKFVVCVRGVPPVMQMRGAIALGACRGLIQKIESNVLEVA